MMVQTEIDNSWMEGIRSETTKGLSRRPKPSLQLEAFALKDFEHRHRIMPSDPLKTPLVSSSVFHGAGANSNSKLAQAKKWKGIKQITNDFTDTPDKDTREAGDRLSILYSHPNLFRALPSPEFSFEGHSAGSQPSATLASALCHMKEREILLEADRRRPSLTSTTMTIDPALASPGIPSAGSIIVVSASATWNVLELYDSSPEASPLTSPVEPVGGPPSFPEKALLNDVRKRPLPNLPPPLPASSSSMPTSSDIVPPPPAHLLADSDIESARNVDHRPELIRGPRIQTRARPIHGHSKSKSLTDSDTPAKIVPMSTSRSRIPPPAPLPLPFDFPLPPLPPNATTNKDKGHPPAPSRSNVSASEKKTYPKRPNRNGMVSPLDGLESLFGGPSTSKHKPSASESSVPRRPERMDGALLLTPDTLQPTRPSRTGVISPLPSMIIERLDALDSLPGNGLVSPPPPPPPPSSLKPKHILPAKSTRSGNATEDVLWSYFMQVPLEEKSLTTESDTPSTSKPKFTTPDVPFPDASILAQRSRKHSESGTEVRLRPGDRRKPSDRVPSSSTSKSSGITRNMANAESSSSRRSDPSQNVSSPSVSNIRPLALTHKKGSSLDSIHPSPISTSTASGSGSGLHKLSSISSSTLFKPPMNNRDRDRPLPDAATLAKRLATSRARLDVLLDQDRVKKVVRFES